MHFFFSPRGRIGRAQWWLGWLMPVTIASVAVILARKLLGADAAAAAPTNEFFAILIMFTFQSACMWVVFCLCAKRYHDRDKSAFWFFIVLVPVIGLVWQIIECGFLPGTPGGNSRGASASRGWLLGHAEAAA